ncbi:hypothetical protein DL95DRAFT_377112 [Leptodontidium sp. 2 PMI_412]|nr:hypothetical protein DL95DRAFT_377112 [Leptodontidium sp. 2 PMI_412]
MPEHILLFGATGGIGLLFCEEALSQGHSLTLLVRNPGKLPSNIRTNTRVNITESQLNDKSALQRVASSGASIFISFAGPVAGSKGTAVLDCMKVLFPLLIANNFKRAMVLGTPSFPAPEDKGGFKWRATIVLVKVIGGSAYEEFHGLGNLVSSYNPRELKWTLFRVPFLGNGDAAPVVATYTGSGKDGLFLSRKSIVAWTLQEMGQDSDWIGKSPMLCN